MVKKMISFKDSEMDLVNYIENKRSFSIYIKDLIEKDMKGQVETIVNIKAEENEGFVW